MTLVKWNARPVSPSFNNFVDDFFTGFSSIYRDQHATGYRQAAPVNVTETKEGYQLQLAAPGFAKEDIQISLENNLLTISAGQKEETKTEDQKQIRQEFRVQSFKRSFTVDKGIDAEQISAQFVNGILTLNLPRKAEVKPVPKQIDIR
jgi:HSP20 family protein